MTVAILIEIHHNNLLCSGANVDLEMENQLLSIMNPALFGSGNELRVKAFQRRLYLIL